MRSHMHTQKYTCVCVRERETTKCNVIVNYAF
jgi:hypothetical protein